MNLDGRTLLIEKRQLVADSSSPPSCPRIWSNQEFRKAATTARITISWDAERMNFLVSNELIIEFEHLFLKSPVAPEHDLVFTRQDLSKLAKAILSGLDQET